MVMVGKPERKRPLEKPRRRWEDVKIDFWELYSFDSGHTPAVGPCEYGNELSGFNFRVT
jgi:hypothetical protein